jgi:hypothetical protein
LNDRAAAVGLSQRGPHAHSDMRVHTQRWSPGDRLADLGGACLLNILPILTYKAHGWTCRWLDLGSNAPDGTFLRETLFKNASVSPQLDLGSHKWRFRVSGEENHEESNFRCGFWSRLFDAPRQCVS